MKKISLIWFIVSTFYAFVSYGQTEGEKGRLLMAANSPKGNYLFLHPSTQRADKASQGSEDGYFIISRMSYDTLKKDRTEKDLKVIGQSKRVGTLKELRAFFTDAEIAGLQKLFHMETATKLAEYFKNHGKPSDYSLAYNLVEVKQALGEVFVDPDVKEGEVFIYSVTRVNSSGAKENWGYSIVQSKSGNYKLKALKPAVNKVITTDSTVTCKWQVPIRKTFFDSLRVPQSKIKGDSFGLAYGLYFNPYTIHANVYVGDWGKFTEVSKVAASVNATKDTAFFSYRRKVVPEEKFTAFVTLEDEIYNKGASSDTLVTYAISKTHLPIISSVKISDVVNGVKVAWTPLPAKPYIAAILVTRIDNTDHLDTLGILTPADTMYHDYNMQPGIHYTYLVKALYTQLSLEQQVPALGIGTVTVFSKPVAPTNLKAENVGKNVKLTWDVSNEHALYGFYIYRGISRNKMWLVAGPVFTKSYLDTSESLGARAEFFYYVKSQNLRQDTSKHSEIVGIRPDREIEVTKPGMIQFYYANHILHIDWDDVRQRDNAITSYIIQRKAAGEKDFKTISTALTKNAFNDSSIFPGLSYQYRIAAVSFRGDVGSFGDVNEFTVAKPQVQIPDVFFVRNVPEGIHVSWPKVDIAGRKGYNVYRREAAAQIFSKIFEANNKTFFYIDKNVKPNSVYVYCLSLNEDDGREGIRGGSKSIRRIQKQTDKPNTVQN